MNARRPLSAHERRLLEVLLSEVGPRLLAYVRRAFGSAVDAEEVVAEAFARAADNMEVLAHCERKDLYLLTTARNLCRDLLRRRRPTGLSDAQWRDCAGSLPRPEESLAAEEQRRRLAAAFGRLPECQREVVALRLSAGLKFSEIAELLEIPLGTALSRMHAALRQLRKELRHAETYRRAAQ